MITREQIRVALEAAKATGIKPPAKDRSQKQKSFTKGYGGGGQDQSLHPDSIPNRPVFYLGGPPEGHPVPLRHPLMSKVSYYVLAVCQLSVWGEDPDQEGETWTTTQIAYKAGCATGEVERILERYLSDYLDYYDSLNGKYSGVDEFNQPIDVAEVSARLVAAVCKFYLEGMSLKDIAHWSDTDEDAILAIVDAHLGSYLERLEGLEEKD